MNTQVIKITFLQGLQYIRNGMGGWKGNLKSTERVYADFKFLIERLKFPIHLKVFALLAPSVELRIYSKWSSEVNGKSSQVIKKNIKTIIYPYHLGKTL